MITIRKLKSLSDRTRARKLLGLLSENHDASYDRALVELARNLLEGPQEPLSPGTTSVPLGRDRWKLRQRLAQYLGIPVADWDLQAPADREGMVVRFPYHVWLDDLRSPFNVGSIIRTAEAYGFSSVLHSPLSPGLGHPRTLRTAMGTEQNLPVRSVDLPTLQAEWGQRSVFALELGGVPLQEFRFPVEGLVLVGSEELGLSPEALAWADGSLGRVSLPLYGKKASLNVGVAFGVLAAAWTASAQKPLSPAISDP